jgi:hypothetical protein
LLSCVYLPACDFPNEWGTGNAQYVPPARATVAITSSTETGGCTLPSFSIPADPGGNPGAVQEALFCNLESASCKPDEYSVVHGDPDVTVTCTISPRGDSFDVNVKVHTKDLSFQAVGTIASSGGTLEVSREGGGKSFRDGGCKISGPPNEGAVKKGVIWAHFECELPASSDASNEVTCTESGAFLFEDCGS